MREALIFQVPRGGIMHDIAIKPSAIVALEYCGDMIRVSLDGGHVVSVVYSIKNYEVLLKAMEGEDDQG